MSGTDKPPLLPLLEALVAWCDPQLVAEARAAEAPFTLAQITEAGVPHLGGAKGLGPAFRYRVQDRYKDELERATLAWHALAADFRNRLEAGEIRLVGVQVAPNQEGKRRAINGLLASEYRFSFQKNTVTGAGYRFVSVRAYRAEPSIRQNNEGGAAADTAANSPPEPLVETAGRADAVIRPADATIVTRRRRGRRAFPMDEMVQLVRQQDRVREATNKGEARRLLEAFRDRFRHLRPPAHSTILDHVNEVYRKAQAAGQQAENVEKAE